MKKLTRQDFKTIKIGGASYLSFKGKKCEICIEQGFGCSDLAVYDLKQELLEPKVTINDAQSNVGAITDYLKLIDETVNNFYQRWGK